MKSIYSVITVATLAFTLPATPTIAAQTDPEIIIYRFPGVHDDGGATNVGIATVFHCSNFSGATENIRLVTRAANGTLRSNDAFAISHLSTVTLVTHFVLTYSSNNSQTQLNGTGTGFITQGTIAIAATATNIICTASTIDAALSKPVGVALRGIRFNPAPGSQE